MSERLHNRREFLKMAASSVGKSAAMGAIAGTTYTAAQSAWYRRIESIDRRDRSDYVYKDGLLIKGASLVEVNGTPYEANFQPKVFYQTLGSMSEILGVYDDVEKFLNDQQLSVHMGSEYREGSNAAYSPLSTYTGPELLLPDRYIQNYADAYLGEDDYLRRGVDRTMFHEGIHVIQDATGNSAFYLSQMVKNNQALIAAGTTYSLTHEVLDALYSEKLNRREFIQQALASGIGVTAALGLYFGVNPEYDEEEAYKLADILVDDDRLQRYRGRILKFSAVQK